MKRADSTPCWKVLTNDAFDGKVDGLYPVAVYGEAVKHLPTDVQSYSSIANVIDRARQDAVQKAAGGTKADPSRCGYTIGASGGSSGGSGTGSGDGKGPIPGIIDKGGPNSADGFPVALIVIAVIAALLVIGGIAGFAIRRRQHNHLELEAASGTTPPDIEHGPRELEP